MDLFILGKGPSASFYDAWKKVPKEAALWTLNEAHREESELHFDVHEDRRFWKHYEEARCRWVVSPFAKPSELHPRMSVFPLKECRREFGAAYFECSIDYMLALAVLQRKRGQVRWTRIWLPGCDMGDPVHYTYRPGSHFWLGVATGMGIEVKLPCSSLLLKRVVDFPATPHGDPEFPHAYGQTRESTAAVAGTYGWE